MEASTANTVATDHVGTSKRSGVMGVRMRNNATSVQMTPVQKVSLALVIGKKESCTRVARSFMVCVFARVDDEKNIGGVPIFMRTAVIGGKDID